MECLITMARHILKLWMEEAVSRYGITVADSQQVEGPLTLGLGKGQTTLYHRK
jgi:hypothetical protein